MNDFINSFLLPDITHSPFPLLFTGLAIFFIAITLLFVIAYSLRKYLLQFQHSRFHQFIIVLLKEIKAPLLFLTIFSSLYLAVHLLFLVYPKTGDGQTPLFFTAFHYLSKLIFPGGLFWLIWRILHGTQIFISSHATMEKKPWLTALFSLTSNGIKAAIILLIANIIIPDLGLTPSLQLILEKVSQILFIAVLGWVFYQIINECSKIVLSQYGADNTSDYTVRKVTTQVILLKRIILTIGTVIVCAAILMTFDNVKHLGAGLLTTAGIISALGAFASQQSLSRLAAGLQMAFTQPIRIGDLVMIDNETGTVEEISLSYIVVKLWNLRRLILPADYLSKTGFHNLSRTSTQLLDTIFIQVDFTLPVQPIREKFFELLAQSKFWDGQVKALHVTATTSSSMEIRALMSAQDGASLWELQCEMREKLIEFIVKNYPGYLPKQRTIQQAETKKLKAAYIE